MGHETREEVSEEIKVRKFQLVGHDQIAKFKVANDLVSQFSDKIAKFFPRHYFGIYGRYWKEGINSDHV